MTAEPVEDHIPLSPRMDCSCGWEPPLGVLSTRAFDRHLLDVRGTVES